MEFPAAESTLSRRIEELEALNLLSRSISSSVSLQDVYEVSLDQVYAILSPDLAILYSVEGEKMKIRGVRTELGRFRESETRQHEVGCCICGLAASTQEIVFSADIGEDARCTSPECKSAGLRSVVSVPLLIKDEVVGVLSIGSIKERDFVLGSPFLQSISAVLAVGIANARLHDQALLHAEELEKTVDRRTKELQKFYNAVEHSQATIVITDADGLIEYVNPYFTTLTGYTEEEALGRTPGALLKSGRHAPSYYKNMWQTLMRNKTWEGELCNIKKDGSLYWEHALISPVQDDSGNFAHFIGVKNDITDRKRNARLREDVDRILRHDLKSPLNVIINLPDMLLADDNLSDDQRESIEVIRDAGLTMLEEINRSLDLYKIETGVYEYKPVPVDFNRVLSRLAAEAGFLARHRNIPLKITVDGADLERTPGFSIEGEELLLHSMISNLLTNAVEASPKGKEVLLEIKTEDGIQIAIRNAGTVPREIQDRFFEKYVTHGKQNGTGLGTYIAALIADTMGGSIEMKSSKQEGTLVRITLPVS